MSGSVTPQSSILNPQSAREARVVRAVCPHDCPDTCSMLVTVENGRAVRMAGDPDHPVTKGFLCTKVAKYLERTYHAGRLVYPQIRVGAKGEGKFRRATRSEERREGKSVDLGGRRGVKKKT